MPPSYNQAVDTLADNLKWMLSKKGIDVLQARAEYLIRYDLTPTSVDDARATIVSILSEAEPVFWPKKFCDIVQASFGTLPNTWRLTDPMLFTPHGFIYFEQPISFNPTHPPDDLCMGKYDQVKCIGWRKARGTVFVDVNTWVYPGDKSLMEVFPPEWMHHRISPQTHAHLERLIRKAAEQEEQEAIKRGETYGDHIRKGYADSLLEVVDEALTAEGSKYRQLMLDAHRETGAIRHGGVPWMITPWRSGQTVEQTSEVHAAALGKPDEACFFCTEGYLRLFGTALNFLSTKVFVSVPSHTDRSVLRRLARNQAHKPQYDSVNVITLRKLERVKHESDTEETKVDWSCHWLVGSAGGGFWRHQPLKNAEGQWIKQWRWIMPYIKGNLDKPFKPPGKRVFDVRR